MPEVPQPFATEWAEIAARVAAREEEQERGQAGTRKAEWLSSGWGGVGVRWCGRCSERFKGAAYVYDGLFGRDYFCPSCYRRMRDLALAEGGEDVRLIVAVVRPCEGCRREFAWIGGQLPGKGGSPFRLRPRPRAHVCSKGCARARRNRHRRVVRDGRPCAACGESFAPSRADALYCSGRCRQRAYRARA